MCLAILDRILGCTDMPDPVLWICGDVHLDGAEAADHAFLRFLEALRGRTPARLVILGDLVEAWIDTAGAVAVQEPVLSRLRRLSDCGWRLDLVLGNRELAAGRRLAKALPWRLHWPVLRCQLGGRQVAVVHGDRLCRDPGYHFLRVMLGGFWFRVTVACLPAWCHALVAGLLRRRSRRGHLRRRRAGVVGARLCQLEPRRLRAAARGVQVLVAGHIHRRLHLEVPGLQMWLVGDWSHRHGSWLAGQADGSLVAGVMNTDGLASLHGGRGAPHSSLASLAAPSFCSHTCTT